MRLKSDLQTLGRIFFWSISLSMPLASAGCGQTACFTWSPDEGSCPAQKEALPFFRDAEAECPGSVVAVDSDGDYANNLCCYTVSKRDTAAGDDFCGALDDEGAGGFGGTTGTGVDVGPGGVDPPSCFRCAQAVATAAFPDKRICSESQTRVDSMMDCICKDTCKSSCGANLCAGRGADSTCLRCLGDTEKGCGVDFEKCIEDS